MFVESGKWRVFSYSFLVIKIDVFAEISSRKLRFESKSIIFKSFFDITFRQIYYSSKSRDSSVIATRISLKATIQIL